MDIGVKRAVKRAVKKAGSAAAAAAVGPSGDLSEDPLVAEEAGVEAETATARVTAVGEGIIIAVEMDEYDVMNA